MPLASTFYIELRQARQVEQNKPIAIVHRGFLVQRFAHHISFIFDCFQSRTDARTPGRKIFRWSLGVGKVVRFNQQVGDAELVPQSLERRSISAKISCEYGVHSLAHGFDETEVEHLM